MSRFEPDDLIVPSVVTVVVTVLVAWTAMAVLLPEEQPAPVVVSDPTLYSCIDMRLHSWDGEAWVPVLTVRFKTPVVCKPYGI